MLAFLRFAGVLSVTGVPAVAIVASVPADPGGVLRIFKAVNETRDR